MVTINAQQLSTGWVVTVSCLSGDDKPNLFHPPGVFSAGLVPMPNGAKLRELDTGKTYRFDADSAAWFPQPAARGGNIPVILQADWDAMTTSQKQAYGLCVIQNAESGFIRGVYVNGADYAPFEVLYSGTGGNSASQSLDLASDAKLLVIAVNSEASTQQLTISAALDGTDMQGTQISYHSYSGSGENRRNYRITAFDIPSGAHSLDISLAAENNYSSFVYVVLNSAYNTINKELTTVDGFTSGSNATDGMVIYGTFDGGNGGTINTELYTAGTTITTQSPGWSYKSSYIFWFV